MKKDVTCVKNFIKRENPATHKLEHLYAIDHKAMTDLMASYCRCIVVAAVKYTGHLIFTAMRKAQSV